MKAASTKKLTTSKFNPKAEWPGSLSLIGKAWRAVRAHPDFVYLFVGILGIFALIDYVVAPAPFFHLNSNNDANAVHTSLLITAASTVISFVLTGPLTLYQLRVADGKKVSTSEVIKTGLSKIIPFIALNIMLIACVAVGLILFILPGIYVAMRLIVANYVFFDKELGPIEALRESFEITRRHFREIASYAGVIILLSLITGALSLFIPVFGNMAANAAVVVYGVVGAWLYRWMAKRS